MGDGASRPRTTLLGQHLPGGRYGQSTVAAGFNTRFFQRLGLAWSMLQVWSSDTCADNIIIGPGVCQSQTGLQAGWQKQM